MSLNMLIAAAEVGAAPSVRPTQRRPKGMIVGKLPAAMLLGERVGDWWAERSAAVRDWIETNPLKIGIPSDRTIETIRMALDRGDKYEAARTKCWFHVLIELEGVASLDVVNTDEAGAALCTANIEAAVSAIQSGERRTVEVQTDVSGAYDRTRAAPQALDSPCRGRLRPDRRVLGADEVAAAASTDCDDDAATAAAATNVAKALEAEGAASAVADAPSTAAAAAAAVPAEPAVLMPPKRKSITASMSMMERNKLWMEQKQEKLQFEQEKKAAEEAAQIQKPQTNSRSHGRWNTAKAKVVCAAKFASSAKGAAASVAVMASSGEVDGGTAATGKTAALTQPKPPEGKSGKGRRPSAADKGNGKGKENGSGSGRRLSAPSGIKLARKKSKANVIGSNLLDDVRKLAKAAEAMKPKPTPPQSVAEATAEESVPETVGSAPSPTAEEAEADSEALLAKAPAPLPPPSADKAALKYAAAGHKGFKFRFAENSTEEKGRFCVANPAQFDASTFYRKRDTGTRQRGVTLVVGQLEDGGREKVSSILFDRDHFDEASASQWWDAHSERHM